jgi:hypothetical protein
MTYAEFAELIEPLYRQFRPRMDAEWKARDMGDRYRALGRFDAPVLQLAVDELIATAEHMPVIAAIRAACANAQQRLGLTTRAEYAPWEDCNACPCGCGGKRWSYVLRTRDGTAKRHFPDGIAALGLPAELAALPDGQRASIAAAMLALAGRVMTRDVIACHRSPATAPRGRLLRTDRRGVPVYDLADDPDVSE